MYEYKKRALLKNRRSCDYFIIYNIVAEDDSFSILFIEELLFIITKQEGINCIYNIFGKIRRQLGVD